jgi:hypothetical protein
VAPAALAGSPRHPADERSRARDEKIFFSKQLIAFFLGL